MQTRVSTIGNNWEAHWLLSQMLSKQTKQEVKTNLTRGSLGMENKQVSSGMLKGKADRNV